MTGDSENVSNNSISVNFAATGLLRCAPPPPASSPAPVGVLASPPLLPVPRPAPSAQHRPPPPLPIRVAYQRASNPYCSSVPTYRPPPLILSPAALAAAASP